MAQPHIFEQVLNILDEFFRRIDAPLADRLKLAESRSYDGILIKKLANSNTLTPNNGNQKHIAFSSKHEINFFPYLHNFVEILAERDPNYNTTEFKRRFGIKIDIRLLKENLEYKIGQTSQDIECFTTYFISRGGAQAEMGSMTSDSEEFTNFRKSFMEDDVIIFLKHRHAFSYDLLVVNKDDYAAIKEYFGNGVVRYASFSPMRDQSTLTSPAGWGDEAETESGTYVTGGVNLIVYGAPGTGKSHTLKSRYESKGIRVTFHPEYTYHDFVGGLRPVVSDEKVTYEFVPGPFALILKEALKNKKVMHSLIIEEINRANTAAVFGDLFQLLDRDQEGRSEYGIQQSELLAFLRRETGERLAEIRIPPNLNIVATMNSADQGVFPMDSAFKRRWNFEYLEISFNGVKQEIQNKLIPYAGKYIKWRSFVEALNTALGELEINEDKHIGPYFMKGHEMDSMRAISSKLLVYLWDDIVRHRRRDIFEVDTYKTFSRLNKGFINGEKIFRTEVIPLSLLEEHPEQPSGLMYQRTVTTAGVAEQQEEPLYQGLNEEAVVQGE